MPVESPLLVTGLPRSGTSWTGKMLEASGQVVYVNEPMSPSRPPGGSPGVLNAQVEHRLHYIDPAAPGAWPQAFRSTLDLRFQTMAEIRSIRRPYQAARAVKYATAFAIGRHRHRRAMLDDPNALFASRWLAEAMGVGVVFLVRDPVGVIGSWRQLGWNPHLDDLLAQDALIRDHFVHRRSDIEQAAATGDWLEQMCCLWNIGNEFIDVARGEIGGVIVRRYEDLAFDPLEQFRLLYSQCGLDFGSEAYERVDRATSSSADARHRGFAWSLRGGISRTAFRQMDSRAAVTAPDQRLRSDEIDLIRTRTDTVLSRFPRSTG
jgi:hypothetical protein